MKEHVFKKMMALVSCVLSGFKDEQELGNS
jgi:hypothetical protein